jgi:hypothetical protein
MQLRTKQHKKNLKNMGSNTGFIPETGRSSLRWFGLVNYDGCMVCRNVGAYWTGIQAQMVHKAGIRTNKIANQRSEPVTGIFI